jgi:hypothetical protein
VIIYCWNYCGKKELWSFTAGITVERSKCYLRLELLWKERALVVYRWNYCVKKQVLFTTGIAEERHEVIEIRTQFSPEEGCFLYCILLCKSSPELKKVSQSKYPRRCKKVDFILMWLERK